MGVSVGGIGVSLGGRGVAASCVGSGAMVGASVAAGLQADKKKRNVK